MKKLLLLLLCLPMIGFGQDNIILKDGEEISAKILRINPENIEYKKLSNLQGPTYTLDKIDVKISSKTAVVVVMASEGYPEAYEKGMRIKGLDKLQNRLIFHAGTRQDSHDTLTTGGRVLNAVGFGEDLPTAIADAYDIVKGVEFHGKFYRRDIGQRGLKYLKKGV